METGWLRHHETTSSSCLICVTCHKRCRRSEVTRRKPAAWPGILTMKVCSAVEVQMEQFCSGMLGKSTLQTFKIFFFTHALGIIVCSSFIDFPVSPVSPSFSFPSWTNLMLSLGICFLPFKASVLSAVFRSYYYISLNHNS